MGELGPELVAEPGDEVVVIVEDALGVRWVVLMVGRASTRVLLDGVCGWYAVLLRLNVRDKALPMDRRLYSMT